MKKGIILSFAALCGVMLTGCSRTDDAKINALEERIEKLEQKSSRWDDNLLVDESDESSSESEPEESSTDESSSKSSSKESSSSTESSTKESSNTASKKSADDVIVLDVGETGQFSGEIIIGEDLDAGAYDIIPVSSSSDSFKLYKDEAAREEGDYKFEWLFPADEDDPEGDSLKNYVLREGNILEIDTTMEFTRVR
ncbi:hypothetical protein ACYSNR_00665 [Enterococcus sp. LJL128]|uniref:hypothetical protein n=1 Tax=Enterococcus sp. LJL51 TaxID=3416656 RepID=UPI003CF327BF